MVFGAVLLPSNVYGSEKEGLAMVDKAEIEIEEGNKEGFEIYGVRE
jgi:hypothetical protein